MNSLHGQIEFWEERKNDALSVRRATPARALVDDAQLYDRRRVDRPSISCPPSTIQYSRPVPQNKPPYPTKNTQNATVKSTRPATQSNHSEPSHKKKRNMSTTPTQTDTRGEGEGWRDRQRETRTFGPNPTHARLLRLLAHDEVVLSVRWRSGGMVRGSVGEVRVHARRGQRGSQREEHSGGAARDRHP